MKIPVLLIFLLIEFLVCQDCPSPPLPLGTTFTPLAVDGRGKVASIEYSCRGELRGVGSSKNMCKEGKWENVSRQYKNHIRNAVSTGFINYGVKPFQYQTIRLALQTFKNSWTIRVGNGIWPAKKPLYLKVAIG
jgi:hypothetical protein